jgi:hypothetical protein
MRAGFFKASTAVVLRAAKRRSKASLVGPKPVPFNLGLSRYFFTPGTASKAATRVCILQGDWVGLCRLLGRQRKQFKKKLENLITDLQ